MFFTLKQFALDHPDVKNPAAYLHYEAKVGRILRLKRDLYTDNPDENPLLIASVLLPSKESSASAFVLNRIAVEEPNI